MDNYGTGDLTCTRETGVVGSGGPFCAFTTWPAAWIRLNAAEIYGTVAETSAEFALSTLLELTEVTT